MAYDSRGYYYRSRRDGGKVGRDYFGRGALAEAADRLLGEFRAELGAGAERKSLADAAFALLAGALDGAVAQRLAAAGYHRHDRGQWRKRRAGLPVPVTSAGPADWDRVQSLALGARDSWAGGDSERLTRLEGEVARLARPGAGPLESVLALRAALAAARLSELRDPAGRRARRVAREAAAAVRALRSVQAKLPQGA